MLRVAVEVEVNNGLGVLVLKTRLVEVLVVFGWVRMIGVPIEDVEEATPSVTSTGVSRGVSIGASVGSGATSDPSVRGVVIAGSVPK